MQTPRSTMTPFPGAHSFIPEAFAVMAMAGMLQKVIYKGDGMTYNCLAYPGSGAVTDPVWVVARVTDATGDVSFPRRNGVVAATPTWSADDLETVAAYNYGYGRTVVADPDGIEDKGDGDEYEIALSVSGFWTAVSDSGWCRVSPAGGRNSGTLTVTVDPIGEEEAREAHITVTSDTGAVIDIEVGQAAPE